MAVRCLRENGIVCVGDDHLGHGDSIRSEEELEDVNI